MKAEEANSSSRTRVYKLRTKKVRKSTSEMLNSFLRKVRYQNLTMVKRLSANEVPRKKISPRRRKRNKLWINLPLSTAMNKPRRNGKISPNYLVEMFALKS